MPEAPKCTVYTTGIYCWRNKITGRRYIGKAEIGLVRRYNQYIKGFTKGKCHSVMLLNAVNKYGLEDFEHVVLEECPKLECLAREIYWISFYRANEREFGYNVCLGGLNNSGAKRSPEACKRMSEAGKKRAKEKPMSQETIDKMAAAHRGLKRSEEQRKRISDATKGKAKSEEHKAKLAAAAKERPLTEEQEQKKLAALASPEVREKLRKAHLGKPLSDKHREALAASIRRPEVRSKISETLKRNYTERQKEQDELCKNMVMPKPVQAAPLRK